MFARVFGLTSLVRRVALTALSLMDSLMLIMAVMSWIPSLRSSRFYAAIETLLDPFLMPIRKLLWRVPALRSCPLDLSFIVLLMLISLLQRLLY